MLDADPDPDPVPDPSNKEPKVSLKNENFVSYK